MVDVFQEITVSDARHSALHDAKHKRSKSKFHGALKVGFIGFSCYLGWVWTVLFGFSYYQFDFYSSTTMQICRLITIIALSLTMFVAGSLKNYVRKPAGVATLFVIALVACLGMPCVMLLKPALSMVYLCWVGLGIGYGALQLLWARFAVTIGHSKKVSVYVSFMFLMAAVLYLVLGLLPGWIGVVATTAIALISCVLGLYTSRYARSRWHEHINNDANTMRENRMGQFSQHSDAIMQQDATGKIHKSHILKTVFFAFVYSIGYGFAGYCGTDFGDQAYSFVAIAAALLLAGVVSFLVSLKQRDSFSKRPLRYFLPLTTVGIFPMLVLNAQGRLICAMYLLFIFTLYGCNNLILQTSASARQGIDPLVQSSFGRLGNSLGMGVGWAACVLAFSSAFADTAITTVLVVVLFLFVFTKAFLFPDKVMYPEEEAMPQKDTSSEDEDSAEERIVLPSAPAQSRGKSGNFKVKCEKLAAQYELTPRQVEVLILLGKGRNATGIEKTLVISNHTAKAHIYNIYKKMDVHSQQQLINMIEEVEISEEDILRFSSH